MPPHPTRVARIDKYADFTSPQNKQGLHVEVDVKDRTGVSEVTIPKHMSGWVSPEQTFAHKGAIASVLDTVMAFSGIRLLKRATNTKSLSIEYFTQVPVETKLKVEARLVQRRGDSEAILEAVIRDEGGTIMARGTGTYALYSVEQLRNLNKFPHVAALALGPRASGFAACRPEDLSIFENMLNSM